MHFEDLQKCTELSCADRAACKLAYKQHAMILLDALKDILVQLEHVRIEVDDNVRIQYEIENWCANLNEQHNIAVKEMQNHKKLEHRQWKQIYELVSALHVGNGLLIEAVQELESLSGILSENKIFDFTGSAVWQSEISSLPTHL